MSTTIRSTLVVTGLFEPEEFTRSVELRPTCTTRVGATPWWDPALEFNEDSWSLVVADHQAIHIDEKLSKLLSVLEPVSARFRSVVESMQLFAQAAFSVRVRLLSVRRSTVTRGRGGPWPVVFEGPHPAPRPVGVRHRTPGASRHDAVSQ
ncbi:DUF4279 domain-containing protein [Nocardia sp. R16R-3T]